MQNRERLKVLIAVAGVLFSFLLPTNLSAQSSSINTYSPYSFYGLGTMSDLGTTNIRSMGGAGIAFRDTYLNPLSVTINSLNPASYSAIPQQSFMFNFELEGENYYLKDARTKSSYNDFNIKNISVLFPLAKKVGFGISVSPYSSVGYRLEEIVTDPDIVANIGHVKYRYDGEGDISQLKMGLGLELFKNFSLGIDFIYYFGEIDRNYTLEVESITGGGGFASTRGYAKEKISKILTNIGFQYNVWNTPKRQITIGGLYTMGGKLNIERSDKIPESLGTIDYLWDKSYIDKRMKMADEYAIGMYYQTHKMSVGFDYTFANWGKKNNYDHETIKYEDTNALKVGFQYTPNRIDVRHFLNRLTYRVGFKYQENYFSIKDTPTLKGGKLDTKAMTLGIGFPIKMMSPTYLNFGLEFGQRGSTRGRMVKENYFKISLGLSFFGEDYWFRKRKYD